MLTSSLKRLSRKPIVDKIRVRNPDEEMSNEHGSQSTVTGQ
jgi:hypothetical protein